MSEKKSEANRPALERRAFLLGAAAAAPAAITAKEALAQEPAPAARGVPERPAAERDPAADVARITVRNPGSDFMVDVLKTLDFDYIATLPGSTFRGLQESLVNYGNNRKPEILTCLHEDTAVALAHGYAKAAGKPMAALVHGVVGLQHASMAIYNAYADQAPVYVITGNVEETSIRRGGAEADHSAHDQAIMVRDYVKWDDQPASLQDFADSAVRAYDIATSGPQGPVLLVADGALQEDSVPADERARLRIPTLKKRAPPQGESGAVEQAAQWLCAAENPVIFVDHYARDAQACANLAALAENLQAAVVNARGQMFFPNRHPLNQSERAAEVLRGADVILALEPLDTFSLLNNMPDTVVKRIASRVSANAKIIRLGLSDSAIHANFGLYQRYATVDLDIAGDAAATMPSLLEAVRRGNKSSNLAARGQKLGEANAAARARARSDAAYGWDTSPVSTARTCMELWDQIRNDDWVLATEQQWVSDWPTRLWNFDKFYRCSGNAGAAGVGYNAAAAIGSALANKTLGRLTVAFAGDGDFLMAPGVIWTAAHHQLPLLMIIHNNRAYHQELMHVQRMANRRSRGIDRTGIGIKLENPNIDYAAIAKGYGVYSEGPVSRAADVGPALRRALAVVKRGEPALIDIVSQPR
jgi:thiamine pyrophosphate-dependent acetolactate synthase large subunit-like protein